MMAVQGSQSFGKADEADGQRTMLQYLPQVVLQRQMVGIQPNALAHEEGVIVNVLAGLDLKAVQQLLGNQFHHAAELFIEQLFVVVSFNGQTGALYF